MTDTNKPDALTQEVADHAATALAEARARCDELRSLQAETQATLDEALRVQDAIWDAVGGQRTGESLVDAVRRVVRQRDEIVGSYNHAQEWLAKIVEAAELREGEDLLDAVQRLARSARRALPKPDRVEVGQWWVYENCEPDCVTRVIDDGEDLFVCTDGNNDAADWVDQASVMLASSRWRYLGNGERPIEPTDGAWSGAIPPEQLQAAVDRMSIDEKEMLASLVSRGESKVGGYYAQQFGAPAGCMCTWLARPQVDGTTLTERGRGAVPCPVHDTRSEEAKMSESTSDECGYCGDPACAEVPARGRDLSEPTADAAYQRGQEEMRERAANAVQAPMTRFVATGELAERIRSLPIAKTPTASAGEDPGEAVPGEVRGAETAGAGESIAQRVDLASRWSERARERMRKAHEERDETKHAYHCACADTYATCASELEGWLGDRVAEGAEVARLKRDLIEATKKRDADIDVWRAATGCETPADARREREADRAAMAKMQDRIAEFEREAKRDGAASVAATQPDVEPWAGDGAQVRAPRVGDMVDLRVSKGVHPCVVLHVWDDGSVNLRDLFDLDEVEGARRGDGIGCWRFRG